MKSLPAALSRALSAARRMNLLEGRISDDGTRFELEGGMLLPISKASRAAVLGVT